MAKKELTLQDKIKQWVNNDSNADMLEEYFGQDYINILDKQEGEAKKGHVVYVDNTGMFLG